MGLYVETSALAKWYLPEAHSDEVEDLLARSCPAYISLLTKAEMRSLLARRVREGTLDPEAQGRVLATFEGDIALGHLVLLPHTVDSFLVAESLLGSRIDLPLRTLDALHLGAAKSSGMDCVATADRVMASAVRSLGMDCEDFS